MPTAQLKEHKRTIHGDRGIYCKECPEKFNNEEDLKDHVQEIYIRKTLSTNTKCDMSNFKVKSIMQIEVHTRKVHGEKGISCNECPKESTMKMI